MNEDPLIPKRDKERNVIESVSGICNIYSKASKSDMFTGAHEVQVALDHSAISPQVLTEPGEINSKDRMKAKFTAWGIDMKWVCLFPHVDDFNGREPGHNFLGCVSRTVNDDMYQHNGDKYRYRKRLTMTFCQRKVNEDTEIREDCVFNIRDGIRQWTTNLPLHRMEAGIKKFARSVHGSESNELLYLATHENKCLYYSIFCSGHRHVTDTFQLGIYRQIEALACLLHCNGPDKYHIYFQHHLNLAKLPTDVLCADFIHYCNDSVGGSVMSKGKGVRHRPHWMKPYLKAEMVYGLCVLLSIVDEANAGVLSKDGAVKRLKQVKLAGELTGNHLFAVAVLRGLVTPRDFLPLEVRHIHRQLKKTVVSMEDPSMKMTGRKRKADVATSKVSSAKVSRNSASYQNASGATSPLPVSKTSGTTSSRTPTTVSKTNASYENARRSGATSSQTPLPVSKTSGTTSSRTPTTVSKTNAKYEKARGSGATSSQTPLPVSNTSGTTSSRRPTTVSKTNTRQNDMEDLVLPINLLEMAKNAWKERYGTDLPQTIPIGDSYKKIGTVWTQSINEPDKPSVYTTTEYPPSVLDESFITLPNDDGVAFKSQKCAKDALHWWIICTFPSANSILSWANELLGNRDYVVLIVSNYSQAWCKLLRDSKGSIWVESKGRKCAVS